MLLDQVHNAHVFRNSCFLEMMELGKIALGALTMNLGGLTVLSLTTTSLPVASLVREDIHWPAGPQKGASEQLSVGGRATLGFALVVHELR